MALVDNPQPDLSLEDLRFLVTLAKARSLTTAAMQHGLSMGSASRRLAHMREVLEDELFIRSGLEMLPTARMRDLLPKLLDLLSMGASLTSREGFDLADTRRAIRLLAVDNAMMTILPDAVSQIAREAPNATLEVSPVTSDLFELLRTGRADLAIYPLRSVPRDFHRLALYPSRRSVLVREGHPLIARYEAAGRLKLEDLRAYRHIGMSLPGAPDSAALVPQVSDFEVALSMPYFLGVPHVIAGTDYVFVAPAVTLMHFLRYPGAKLRMLPAPEEIAAFDPAIIWHHGTHTDPFLQWVRAVILQSARAEAKRFDAIES